MASDGEADDTLPGGDQDGAPVLGAATADQVLEQWKVFLESSSRTLREMTLCQGDAHLLPAKGPAITKPGGANVGGVSPAEKLGLYDTAAGQAAAFICTTLRESRLCVASAQGLFRHLALFGERETTDAATSQLRTDSASFVEFAELLPKLQNIAHVLSRVASLTEHLLRQLVGLHAAGVKDGRAGMLRGMEQLQPPWPVIEALGELLMVPVIMDGLVLENERLKEAFRSYLWLVSNAKNADAELPADRASELQEKLRDLEPLLCSDSFKECIMRVRKGLETLRLEASVTVVRERLVKLLRAKLEELAKGTESSQSSRFALPADSLVPAVCSLVLVLKAWPGKSDMKLVNEIWKLHRNVKPVVVLQGRVAWCIGDFLQAQFPDKKAEAGLQEDMKALRQKQAARLDDGSFVSEMRKLQIAVQGWLGGIGSTVRALSGGDLSKSLKDADWMLKRGLVLALKVRGLLEEYLILHIRENLPIQKSCLKSISCGFQLLKVIESGPSTLRWPELSVFLHRHLVLKVHRDLQDSLRMLEKKRKSGTVLSISAAVKAALGALHEIIGGGAPSEQLDDYFDLGALALCLSADALPKGGSSTQARWLEVRLAFRWQQQLVKLCDTSWCFWLRALFPSLLTELQTRPRGASSLCGLTQAFAAPLEELLSEDHAVIFREYLYHMRSSIQDQIVAPLSQVIEKDIRSNTYAVMNGQLGMMTLNAKSDARAFLALRPLRLGPKVVLDIKDQIELRLGKQFYDLTALQPQDAETYQRMRVLAKERYGLDIIDGALPAGSQDNGLDVMNLMREIHKLAAQYSYSVHHQFFAQSLNEQVPKLHVVTLDHVAASVKIHGVGISDTAAAFSFPFLLQKLQTIMKFMMNDNVRSRLMQDKQWLDARTREGQRGYTWARAEETLRAMRAMGATNDKTYFFDKWRLVITHIGNSLGYVRTVRNAGLRVIAKSFPVAEVLAPTTNGRAPDAEAQDRSLLGAAKAGASQGRVLKAVGVADDFAQGVHKRFKAPADYLLTYTNVFSSPEHRAIFSAKGANFFHLLVPALSLSFLDSLLVGREALEKRAASSATSTRNNAFCFDDGFAVGIAFLLRIFGLEKDFQALHWFEAQANAANVDQSSRVDTVAGVMGRDGGATWATARREALQAEMAVLDRTLEVASTLFGPPMREKPAEAPAEEAPEDAAEDGAGEGGDAGDAE